MPLNVETGPGSSESTPPPWFVLPISTPKILPSSLVRPPARPLATGLNAAASVSADIRSARFFNTSSNCLPPTIACAKALLVALVKHSSESRDRRHDSWSFPTEGPRPNHRRQIPLSGRQVFQKD